MYKQMSHKMSLYNVFVQNYMYLKNMYNKNLISNNKQGLICCKKQPIKGYVTLPTNQVTKPTSILGIVFIPIHKRVFE